jgi:hypothetical protein
VLVGRFLGRLFWSEEQQAKQNARVRRSHVWVHPALWLATALTSVGAFTLGLIAVGDHVALLEVLFASLLASALILLAANDLIVRIRRRRGWTPIVGVHTRPPLKAGEGAVQAWWRWLMYTRPQP